MSNGVTRILCKSPREASGRLSVDARPTGRGQNCIFRLIVEAVTGHRYLDLNYCLSTTKMYDLKKNKKKQTENKNHRSKLMKFNTHFGRHKVALISYKTIISQNLL